MKIINSFLQGNGKTGLSETWRFLSNIKFGLLGVLDFATDMGLERHNEHVKCRFNSQLFVVDWDNDRDARFHGPLVYG